MKNAIKYNELNERTLQKKKPKKNNLFKFDSSNKQNTYKLDR